MTANGASPVANPASAPAQSTQDKPLLDVRDLVMHFPLTQGIIFQRKVGAVRAVDGVSFSIRRGETLGLVGASGGGGRAAGPRARAASPRPRGGAGGGGGCVGGGRGAPREGGAPGRRGGAK